MIVVALLAFALVSVPLTGGRLSRLAHVELRSMWLVTVGFSMQYVVISVVPSIDHRIALGVHLLSYALAAAFFVLNRRVAWMWLIGLGGGFNLLAIAVNGGVMPASDWAVRVSGNVFADGEFANSRPVAHPRLLPLGDVLAIPDGWPLANVFSVGDVLLVVGVTLLLHAACGRRATALAAAADDLAVATPVDAIAQGSQAAA